MIPGAIWRHGSHYSSGIFMSAFISTDTETSAPWAGVNKLSPGQQGVMTLAKFVAVTLMLRSLPPLSICQTETADFSCFHKTEQYEHPSMLKATAHVGLTWTRWTKQTQTNAWNSSLTFDLVYIKLFADIWYFLGTSFGQTQALHYQVFIMGGTTDNHSYRSR